MTRQQFISILESRLAALPADERRELIQDVESHFIFGLHNGRTEEEIARELGDPFEIARDALSGGYIEDIGLPSAARKNPTSIGKIAACIGLVFCGMIAYPLIAALWSFAIAVAALVLACLISPALVLAEYIINGSFYPAKLFLSVSLVGVGILLVYGARSIFRRLSHLTRGYSSWNVRVMKGSDMR